MSDDEAETDTVSSPRFVVAPSEAGKRLDKIVALRLGLGRRRVAELFAQGAIEVQGRPTAKGGLARAGSSVTVNVPPGEGPLAEPGATLSVRLETDQLVVVDKPAGQPSAALRPGERGSLAGALLGHYPEMKHVGYGLREPGLIHRLDTGTSGLLVAARTEEAFLALREALKRGALSKRYLAIVAAGALDPDGEITSWLAPEHRGSARVVVAASSQGLRGARQATTRWHLVRTGGPWQLLEVTAPHAYRHQVRAHLAALGCPIAGDQLYGGQKLERLGLRHALHASYVAWAGDAMLPRFEVLSELPDELEQLLRTA
jgi:23S rRNA pseudouridine1911/1915/1917 synthase